MYSVVLYKKLGEEPETLAIGEDFRATQRIAQKMAEARFGPSMEIRKDNSIFGVYYVDARTGEVIEVR